MMIKMSTVKTFYLIVFIEFFAIPTGFGDMNITIEPLNTTNSQYLNIIGMPGDTSGIYSVQKNGNAPIQKRSCRLRSCFYISLPSSKIAAIATGFCS
jgi:hypothetical protein